MRRCGRRSVYLGGLLVLAFSTGSLALVQRIALADRRTYTAACLLLRAVQGLGMAFAESAAYVLVVGIDRARMSYNLALCEVSTGLGLMLGPAVGGLLFSRGGVELPFVAMSAGMLAAALIGRATVPDDRPARALPRPRAEPAPCASVARQRRARVSSALPSALRVAFLPMWRMVRRNTVGAIAAVGFLCARARERASERASARRRRSPWLPCRGATRSLAARPPAERSA